MTVVETSEQAKSSEFKERKVDQHNAKDLDAQIRAANAAEEQILPAWLGTILNAVGTGLLVWTLLETRKATGASRDAADSAEKTLRADRAWLISDGVHCNSIEEDGVEKIYCMVKWLNTGRGPAINVVCVTKVYVSEVNGPPQFTERHSYPDAPKTVLGAGKDVFGPVFRTDAIVSRLIWAGTNVIDVYGRVEYFDIFEPIVPRVSEVYYRTFVSKNADGLIVVQSQPIGPQNSVS